VDSTFELPAEQAMVVADEDSPVFLGGTFESIASCYADHDLFVEAFRSRAGVGWQEHDERLFSGALRQFRPAYATHLVDEWLPALDGVVEKLRAGASVADVGADSRWHRMAPSCWSNRRQVTGSGTTSIRSGGASTACPP
jgi:hypothetical protein